uniref:G-rich RNA sequence binding factor 1 n=1 Tax=Seriola lalandi dorsalis TaxID=1841481 RepID=A0A3B4ZDU5_SERLL
VFPDKHLCPCEDEYPPLPAYQAESEPEKKEVFIIKVKGLPWSCSAQDLLQFFSECRIRDGVKGIHLTVDKLGRPSGRAFIEMEHEEDVGKALEKHRQYLGPRYVEVYEVTNSDAETILRNALQAPADDCVVRLRGLPFSCTEADIAQFFSGLDIMKNGITLIKDHRGRKSGDGFVQFSSQESASQALQRDRERGDHFCCLCLLPLKTDVSAPSGYRQSSAVLPHYVHMRGLPFQVSGEDIVKFFSPLVVSKILIECGPDGKPSGEAEVYFSCHQDAVAAMSKDRMYIGETVGET